MNGWDLVGWIFGGITSIGGSVFYLRYTATKANIEGKNETIKTQNDQIAAIDNDRTRLNTEMAGYKKQAEAFREIAQQTPQIIELTRAVTRLTGTMDKQHKENLRERKELSEILSKLSKKI